MSYRQMPVCPAELSEWRKRKGILLSAIAASTKISPRYLDAIERCEFHRLPGGAYNLSYIRQYAQAIEYQEDELVEYYRSIAAAEEASKTPLEDQEESWSSRFRDGFRSLRVIAGLGGVPQTRG
jgi:cytoskeletal protein RodZ